MSASATLKTALRINNISVQELAAMSDIAAKKLPLVGRKVLDEARRQVGLCPIPGLYVARVKKQNEFVMVLVQAQDADQAAIKGQEIAEESNGDLEEVFRITDLLSKGKVVVSLAL